MAGVSPGKGEDEEETMVLFSSPFVRGFTKKLRADPRYRSDSQTGQIDW